MKHYQYNATVKWTGNEGSGTKNYKSYTRDHSILIEGKYQEILASSDPSFLGDKTRYNPEDLFISSLSACHMLWYLHLCSVHKIIVIDYIDKAVGVMVESKDGSGKFKQVTLNPVVTIENEGMVEKANEIHSEANKMCFIANSCNFKIEHNPKTIIK
ncbi:organic hydroperoxide reductase OsmC/OhrA [Aquimarina sp. MAR_2010_214]|uniref:OsmC family protein n=1 Tax=Aquimarina sp. MAR_2010_214 TaxID=1250026 RepID=UPI000C710660|nr:OsmC family protein [Aquimarina sp. MAR_2010_214]PKV51150.1 organic hydroperoxide reductase OsmC/OhrA [Aquimarina sp. MAR_2010_214]